MFLIFIINKIYIEDVNIFIMRKTKQKMILEKLVGEFKSFFTAEELALKVMDHKIGIATVYRYLNSRANTGKLHSYLCDRKTIYSVDKNSHSHFNCIQCGVRKHMAIKKLDFLKMKEKICHFQIDVTGICEKCLKE